jgi:tartrate dehydratase beta subunit/fumarate hydratase class I family protein
VGFRIKHCIKRVEVLEYPEFGMEAIWRIEGADFTVFIIIIIDDKGNDFSRELNRVRNVPRPDALSCLE